MMRTATVQAAALLIGLGLVSLPARPDAAPAAPHGGPARTSQDVRQLPPVPEDLPRWLASNRRQEIFPRRGPYNYAIYNIPDLARDLNAIAVGHSMAYEDLVTGKEATLETVTWERIHRVLKNPPRFMPDEDGLAPTFHRRYNALEKVFAWAHILHEQTVDVLASTRLTHAEKDAEIERLYEFYLRQPWAITPLPLNMGWLDDQPYSTAFREKYPKVNALFWGYHWLQGSMYDLLYRKTLEQQLMEYEVIGKRYHEVELYRTDRYYMPMFAEVAPAFSTRFPHLANIFDNLHMLHDLVNDILAVDGLTERQRREQIDRAIWLVIASTHAGESPGDHDEDDPLHDHRHPLGVEGMGMMKGATPTLMYMQDMGWMNMIMCGHCTMPVREEEEGWPFITLAAESWTMRMRCMLCARDMAYQSLGHTIIRAPSEDPDRTLVLIADERGEWTTDTPDLLFLEMENGHATCDRWSRVFSSPGAFHEYLREHPEYAGANAHRLDDWADLEGKEPDTYVRPEGPVENPYVIPPGGQPFQADASRRVGMLPASSQAGKPALPGRPQAGKPALPATNGGCCAPAETPGTR